MKITVPMVPPSPNQLRRTYRHYQAYKRLRDGWQRTIWALKGSSASSWESNPRGKVLVRIHIEHGRLFDPDNLVGACKPVLDSLKNLCFIRDDSTEFLELKVTQERSIERKTTIEIQGCM